MYQKTDSQLLVEKIIDRGNLIRELSHRACDLGLGEYSIINTQIHIYDNVGALDVADGFMDLDDSDFIYAVNMMLKNAKESCGG